MRIYKIISAVPMEHYKNQKGFDVIISQKVQGAGSETKIWMSKEEYEFRLFLQEKFVLDNLHKKDAEKLFELIEEFGQNKYYEGSSDEAMSNSESI